jgi:transcription initiation factor TFIIH subunit 2
MADSDGEYVGDLSDDELGDHGAAANASSYGTRSKAGKDTGKKGDGRKGKGGRSKAAWEDITRSWENVVETEDGSITIDALLEAEKRRRLMRDTTPLQRGIIRHLMLVLDMSFAMAEKDLLPNRYLLTLNYAVDFVREYFEQNPISQMGIVGMRDGIAVRISDMGGNPTEHVEKLRTWAEQQEPQGNPSLQNALEMCRGALLFVHLPPTSAQTRHNDTTNTLRPAIPPPTAPARSSSSTAPFCPATRATSTTPSPISSPTASASPS